MERQLALFAPGDKATTFVQPTTQTEMILAALRRGERLTPLDALRRFGCFRLAARIDDLRRAGHEIVTETRETDGKRYAVYHLTHG